jgi:hypothetical protein
VRLVADARKEVVQAEIRAQPLDLGQEFVVSSGRRLDWSLRTRVVTPLGTISPDLTASTRTACGASRVGYPGRRALPTSFYRSRRFEGRTVQRRARQADARAA